MTQIDTSKIVCPPLVSASDREWHLYSSYRREQGRADRRERELRNANCAMAINATLAIVMTVWSAWICAILKTIPEDEVDIARSKVLEWIGI